MLFRRLSRFGEGTSHQESGVRGLYVPFLRREEPIKLGVPFRSLGEQIDQGLNRAELYRDMPRGRKRAGWKKEFLQTLSEAAKDIGEISEEEIQRTIRGYREERRIPEISVAAEV